MTDWADRARHLSNRVGLVTRVARRALRSPGVFFADLDGYLRRRGDLSSAGTSVKFTGIPSIVPLNVEVDTAAPARLNVLLPGLAMRAMSGGPNTVLNLTYRLAAAGVPVRYVSTDMANDADLGAVWTHLSKLSGVERRLDNVEIVNGCDRSQILRLGERDMFLATAWWTAQLVAQLLPRLRTRRFFYMVQEFEPGLYPMSSEYALALETYGLDCDAIVCSRLLNDHLVEERVGKFADPDFRKRSLVFEPAIDRTRFFCEAKPSSSRRRLLFYGRPTAPRNLWELGLAVLNKAVKTGVLNAGDWEVVSMGEPAPSVELGRGVVLRPHPWLDYDGYAALLRSADVGLSLMLSPHTSYPPLEMAACGVPVVTNTFGAKNQARLGDISTNLVAAEANVDALVAALSTAMGRSVDERRRGAEVAVPASWSEVFAPVVRELAKRWHEATR